MHSRVLGILRRFKSWAALALASVALVSCGDNELSEYPEDDEMAVLDPWHMWGNTQIFEVPQTMTAVPSVVGGQLIKVAYGRPETWSFFFAARLVETINDADDGNCTVDFIVTQGIGRSHLTITPFESFSFAWTWTPLTPFPAGKTKYSTSAVAPDRDDSAVTSIPNAITELVAQDIQVQVQLRHGGADFINNILKVEVSAFVAPKAHIRPEWFERTGIFRGKEDNGS